MRQFGEQNRVRIAAAAVLLIVVTGTVWFVWRSSGSQRHKAAGSAEAPTASNAPTDSETKDTNDAAVETAEPDSPSLAAIEIALIDNGRLVHVDRQGNLSGLPLMTGEQEQAIKLVLRNQQARVSNEISELVGRTSNLMGQGESESFELLTPVATVVATDRPTFRWQPLEGASRYAVAVLDENFNVVAESGPLTSASWKPERGLARGKIYLWQVTAEKDGRKIIAPTAPAPEARFKVLSATGRRELQRAEQDYSGSHLILGALYAEAGLLDDAEREFRALLKANPQSAIVKKLVRSVKTQHR
jgi:hypothetical protein